jgi:hypothetical protein
MAAIALFPTLQRKKSSRGDAMSKHVVRALSAVGTALVAIAMVVPVAQAEATQPGYEQFAGCPNQSESPSSATCLRYTFSSGHIRIGKKEIPISNPMTLSGGIESLFGGAPLISNSKGGLEPVKQPVPGGLIGSTKLDWLSSYLNLKQLALYAAIELVGQPIVMQQEIQMPVRVHLINPVLGDKCYVGSSSNPIALNLTTGTTSPPPPNEPITGKSYLFSFEPELEILNLLNGEFVDNAFATPGVSGCALNLAHGAISLNINSLINQKFGLPARAGTNEAVLGFSGSIASREFVYSQE